MEPGWRWELFWLKIELLPLLQMAEAEDALDTAV